MKKTPSKVEYFSKIIITFTTNLPEVDTFIVEDLDTVSPVVWNENLLAIIYNYTIGELQMLGTTKLVENIAGLIENDDPHNLAFNYNDAAFVVNGNSSGVLQNIGAKFTHKLAILVVNLDLKNKQKKICEMTIVNAMQILIWRENRARDRKCYWKVSKYFSFSFRIYAPNLRTK